MSELDVALFRLQGVKKITNGFQAHCPCHNDNVASLSLSETKEGKLLIYCHAGCSFENIIKALDLPFNKVHSPSSITDIYDYIDAEGKLLYQVIRYHPKAFKQRRPNGEGDWVWDLKGIIPTLYHLPEIIEAIKEEKQVFIVEGEKDADNLRKCRQVATTISGGVSTKWHPSLMPLFEGAKIIIIPDKDKAGINYATYVANLLYGWCLSLKLITLPAKDVSAYLETQTIDNLLNIVYNTSEYIPSGAVTREEFNGWRGINQYLWRLLLKQKAKSKSKYS